MKQATKPPLNLSDDKGKSKQVQRESAYAQRTSTADTRPSPYEFDEFMPWMCLQYQSPEIVAVIRVYQEDYVRVGTRRASTKSAKSVKTKQTGSHEMEQPKDSKITQTSDENIVKIKAYYNLHGQLQEVSIPGCPISINRTIIQIFSMAAPYHPTLSKFTINKGGLTATILVEIAKLLPHSFLTDICFDDTNVPQKNYTVLLQNSSKLKNLSLNRCGLGDETCKEIAASIDIGTPGGTLRTLELGSNIITDAGALAFANVLRRNRHLLHLNLSGNIITDKGAEAILGSLMEFPMRYDEIADMKRNRLQFNRKKIEIYERYVKETMIDKHRMDTQDRSISRTKNLRSATNSNKTKTSVSKKYFGKKAQAMDSVLIEGEATDKTLKVDYSHPELEQKARDVVGEFHDPFDANHIILKNRYFYCVGNMFLCSLNLAYNNLQYHTVKKIDSVLEYQSEIKNPPGTTGLLRITFDGNYVPKHCEEYVHIEMFLQNAIVNQLPKVAPGKKKMGGYTTGTRKSTGKL